ncbi:transcriptional regulator [Staphylococcus pettenkoferi]|uniref:helix-turn-helix domain-containing protein n=1 Tax=Staphylococcus pettenkoferi TaxID=170573 RepID=UPI000F53578B|nr:helix-turn-helix transcriptional regulator [Staphylococcus pettenkoferi]RQN00308.1 transcriptional regulator [Staphylococcus pettenkoferi]
MCVDRSYRIDLKRKRLSLKLTQQEVALKVGISRSFYSDIENGNSFPSGRMLLRINEVLPIFLSISDADSENKEAK